MVEKVIMIVLLGAKLLQGWRCRFDEFQCVHPEDGCIPYEHSCNGWIDCLRDGSDESDEECGEQMNGKRYVPEGYYQCGNITHIVRWEQICNGDTYGDCRDRSDESVEFCERFKCDLGMWKCASDKKCITENSVCDNFIDCGDRSDEDYDLCENRECPTGQIKMTNCDKDEFACHSWLCIPLAQRCDGEKDCSNGEDEEHCDWVQPTSICLPISQICDGQYDLNNWEDEQNCSEWTCAEGYRKCDNNLQCVPESKFCDWIYDCPDYSDETRSKCHPESGTCDVRNQAMNELEETTCSLRKTCAEGFWRCFHSWQCIPEMAICNGIHDCEDFSDEVGCEYYICPPDMWKCRHTHICIQMASVCYFIFLKSCCTHYEVNGTDSTPCRDYSHQDEEMCKTHICAPGYSKISSGKCMKDTFICDGNLDTTSGLDEIDCESHICFPGYIKCADMKTCVLANDVCARGLPSYIRMIVKINQFQSLHNCPDLSDELCEDPCVPDEFTGRYTMMKCSEDNKKCIPVFWYCDGKSDCPQGSDEIDCSCEDLGMVECVTQENNTACIPITWACQGHPACSNFDDTLCEVHLRGYLCEETQFWCHLDRKCIDVLQVCDNMMDCTGGEDEAYCSGHVNEDRPNYVYASEDIVHQDPIFHSDPRCFFQPEDVKCYNLHFVLGAILTFNLTWIEVIYIEDIDSGYNVTKEIDVREDFPEYPRVITIKCKVMYCKVSKSWFTIVAYTFKEHVELVVEGVVFEGGLVTLNNVNIHFHNVQFLNSVIDDNIANWPKIVPSELVVKFSDVTFENSADDQRGCISFKMCPTKKIEIEECRLENCSVDIKAKSVWFQVSHSWNNLRMSKMSVQGESMISLYFNNFLLSNQFISTVPIYIMSSKLFVGIYNSTVSNCYGGIVLKITDSGQIDSWIEFTILDTTFFNCSKDGYGGALDINYNLLSHNFDSFLTISNTNFSKNKVSHVDQSSYGGAISIRTQQNSNNHGLKVKIKECNFINNKAKDGAGALYVTRFNAILLSNCSFLLNDPEYISAQSIFVKSASNISMVSCTFSYKLEKSISLLDIDLRSDPPSSNKIASLSIDIACLPWYRIFTSTHFQPSSKPGIKILQKYESECRPCDPSYYIPRGNVYTVVFAANATAVKTFDKNTGSMDLKCLECPYGGECTGSEVKAKPNYWGYKYNGLIIFQQCPLGYCCTGSEIYPCTTYDICLGKRNGRLCGTCEEGYSLSAMSNQCIPNVECSASWLWPAGIIAAVGYMLWYTFKDDILNFPAKLVVTISTIRGNNIQSEVEDIDKGYFGILTYFIQAALMMRLSVGLETVGSLESTMQNIEKYIGLALSIELSYVSQNWCPFVGITTFVKLSFKLVFLQAIYISWLVLFLMLSISSISKICKSRSINVMKLRFIKGIVEIIKYTYGGFTGIIFICLTCVTVGDDFVWKYDGTVYCWSQWQQWMIVVCSGYVIPFPIMLIFGLKLLQQRRITSTNFIFGCIVPLPFLIIWTLKLYVLPLIKTTNVAIVKVEPISHSEQQEITPPSSTAEILNSFQGAYRVTHNGTQYWESVMILRRLLLGSTSLLQNPVVQIVMCSFLSMIFLFHHIVCQPFLYNIANLVESISLFLLCIVSSINLLKSFYIQMGIIPQGSDVNLFYFLRCFENSMILLLMLFIIILEIRAKFRKQEKCVKSEK